MGKCKMACVSETEENKKVKSQEFSKCHEPLSEESYLVIIND